MRAWTVWLPCGKTVITRSWMTTAARTLQRARSFSRPMLPRRPPNSGMVTRAAATISNMNMAGPLASSPAHVGANEWRPEPFRGNERPLKRQRLRAVDGCEGPSGFLDKGAVGDPWGARADLT